MKTIIVPLDNRPVTYVFPQLIGHIAGLEIITPPRDMMGSLTANTSVETLCAWLDQNIAKEAPDCILVCLDSIIYGGLIPSRRSTTSLDALLTKLAPLPNWKKLAIGKTPDVYAQSSIMRISDNNDNIEEKEYWSQYGRQLFAWSAALHRLSSSARTQAPLVVPDSTLISGTLYRQEQQVNQLEHSIPSTVRQDYLDTRWRNFQINKELLDYVSRGAIDYLVFSQDDSGEFGLNVLEKNKLIEQARQRHLPNVVAYAGADEVIMSLLGLWLVKKSGRQPSALVTFSPTAGSDIASRYEGQTIGQSVDNQLKAVGLQKSNSDSAATCDLQVVVHTSGQVQGDHIHLPGLEDMRHLNTEAAARETIAIIENSPAPVVLCDVAYANGADPLLLELLLDRPDLLAKLWGYAGWNTTGNTLGSALSTGVASWFADTSGTNNSDRHKKLALFIRLADDWAYQTQVRKELDGSPDQDRARALLQPHLERLAAALQIPLPQCRITFPWQRTFEIELAIELNEFK